MTKKLNAIMEFDHIIMVMDNGMVMDYPGTRHAPNLLDDELDNSDWEFFSTGYTGQHGYSGPIMHNSEFIGGLLEEDILSSPGVYCAIVSYYTPEDYDPEVGEMDADGWAIVKLRDGLE